MKKLLLSATLTLCSLHYAMAKCYTVFYHNTTPKDADKGVASKHTDVYNHGDINQLHCEGSGELVCQFSDGTCPSDVKIILNEIKADVQRQLELGHFDGTQIISTGQYTWTATDKDNSEISYYTND